MKTELTKTASSLRQPGHDSAAQDPAENVPADVRKDFGADSPESGESLRAACDGRLQRIWEHPLFQESLLETERLERDRIFCGHDRNHLLDVARIAYIEDLETGAGIPGTLIYAAALLHDIGRHLQYTKGIPHHEASADIAARILPECGFGPEDTAQILDAILSHRDKTAGAGGGLSGMIYRADKRSRCCFACPAEPECDWSAEKKNMTLTV